MVNIQNPKYEIKASYSYSTKQIERLLDYCHRFFTQHDSVSQFDKLKELTQNVSLISALTKNKKLKKNLEKKDEKIKSLQNNLKKIIENKKSDKLIQIEDHLKNKLTEESVKID